VKLQINYVLYIDDISHVLYALSSVYMDHSNIIISKIHLHIVINITENRILQAFYYTTW